jgi:signal recognition particle receptor subunit beta
MNEPSVINFKLVVTGPFAAGKTTFIEAVSEIPVVSTETGTTDGAEVKDHTTVTMDFGKISVTDDDLLMELYLFGTPGQSRFDFMWDILSRGMLGYVLLVDASRPDTWAEAAGIKQRFDELGSVPMVVAANRCADAPPGLAESVGVGLDVPIVPCQAVDKESVKTVLLTLLIGVVEQLENTVKGSI